MKLPFAKRCLHVSIDNFFKYLNQQYRKIRAFRKKPDVWVLDEEKFIFIQLRKVASRSFKASLSKFILEKTRGKMQEYPTQQEIAQIDKHYTRYMTAKNLHRLRERYFIFTFVRNPLARLYSCYLDKVVKARKNNYKNVLASYGIHFDMNFADFARRVAEIPDLYSNTHFRSMHKFLEYDDKIIPHFIGKLENLDHDWLRVQEKLSLPDLPHKNLSKQYGRATYREAYSKELANITYQRFQRDVDLFGYYDDIRDLL